MGSVLFDFSKMDIERGVNDGGMCAWRHHWSCIEDRHVHPQVGQVLEALLQRRQLDVQDVGNLVEGVAHPDSIGLQESVCRAQDEVGQCQQQRKYQCLFSY